MLWDVDDMENNDLSFYKNRKVFITGHTGFKGSWMCRVLQLLGASVYGYALAPAKDTFFDMIHISDTMSSFIGDIRDYDNLLGILKGVEPEIVIHMAAQPIVRESYRNPRYTYDVNVMGTVNIMECSSLVDSVKSIVNVTTDKVYRNEEHNKAFTEDDILDGYDPYSNSKSCSELVTAAYRRSFFDIGNKRVSSCRAGNVIGGGDFAVDRIIPDCYRAASRGETIIVRNPYSVRPYQHVLEPVMAYLIVAMRQYQEQCFSGSYNIGPDNDNCVTTGAIVELFCDKWEKYTGSRLEWKSEKEDGPHEAGYLKLDNSLYKNTFGYGPIWNVGEAVDKTVEWYATFNRFDARSVMDEQISHFLSALTEK